MDTNVTPEILVTSGPLRGRRFAVPKGGLQLGRSSTCDIAVKDPELSRSHCLFEARGDGRLWIVDLKSANGTEVNGAPVEESALAVGDKVTAGETEIEVVAPAGAAAASGTSGGGSAAAPEAPAAGPAVDLGLSKEYGGGADGAEAPRRPLLRPILWAAAALAVVVAGALIALAPRAAQRPVPIRVPESPKLVSLEYEKVEADTNGIFRYAMTVDSAGELRVAIDDVPQENRHVNKAGHPGSNSMARLSRVLEPSALYALDREYTGVAAHPNELRSFRLKIVRGTRIFETSIENAPEPEAFRAAREALEAFSKNELGIWAIQYSSDKLLAMSEEARRTGDAKWSERDVQFGNVAAAIRAYREAVFYLDTVNPKPDGYAALADRLQEAMTELDRRYKDQRFLADRAINLGDWEAARRELRVLCDLVPEEEDPRHAEASAKLLDVEGRMKKGARR